MCSTFSFKVTSGVDSAARVLTTLRRKQFVVKEFSMTEIDSNNSQLKITLEDSEKLNIENAVLQMQKLVDVYDVEVM
ncbi:MAG: hypothetical protein K0Q97_395 [Bacillota bacterium]|nr:hypothetical protein [Bacillota bacterium]